MAALDGTGSADADIGLFFVALKPPGLAGAQTFTARVDAILGALGEIPGADGGPLDYPGSIEARVQACRARTGIPVDRAVAEELYATASALGLAFDPIDPLA